MQRALQAVISAAMVASSACGGGGGAPLALPPLSFEPVAQADPGSTLPSDWRHGAFIEIYVRGFKDADGDGHGDLRGLIDSLDYLAELGVSGIWLMPVTLSQDHDHGYAVVDYRAIEPAYGSLADFDELLAKAHARGIGVIVDYVINHSAAQSPLFVHSSAAPSNEYRDWYVWQPSVPGGWSIYGANPWHAGTNGAYFGAFSRQMPEFNLRNADVVAWHHDNLRSWLNRGVDGFRLDAVGNLIENGPSAWETQPDNDAVLDGVRMLVAGYENRFVVCEAPGAPLHYAGDARCGGSFAFGHHADLIGAAKGELAAIARVATYPLTAPAGMMPLLSNHDAFVGQRVWDQLGGNVGQYRLAAAMNLLQAGTPFIYYGEEIGMAGAASLSGDHRLRTPMSWSADARGFTSGTPFRALSANTASNNVATQRADPDSLWSFYKAVIALRKSRASLLRGRYESPQVQARVLSFRRVLGDETTLLAFNYGVAPSSAALTGLPAGATLDRLWPRGAGDIGVDASGSASVALPAQSFAVLALR